MSRNPNIKASVIREETESAETEEIMWVVKENYLPETVGVQSPYTIIRLEYEEDMQSLPSGSEKPKLWCDTIVLLEYSNATLPDIRVVEGKVEDKYVLTFTTPEDGAEGFDHNEVAIGVNPPLIGIKNGEVITSIREGLVFAGMEGFFEKEARSSMGSGLNKCTLTNSKQMQEKAKTRPGIYQISESMLVCVSRELFARLPQANLKPQQVLVQNGQFLNPN